MEDPAKVIEDHKKRVAEMNGELLEVAPNGTSLDLLQAVYRSPYLPLATRMRAAMAALQFEHPKLGVTAIIDAGDIADRLDRAIERSSQGQVKLIEPGRQVQTEPLVSAAEMNAPFPKPRRRA